MRIGHRLNFLLILTGLLWLPAETRADDPAAVEFQVGGRSIKIPPPAGFLRCDGVFAEWDRAVAGFNPPENRTLAQYSTPEDLARLENSEYPEFSQSFNIQVVRELESTEIGEVTFSGMRDGLRQEMKQLESNLGEKMQDRMAAGNKTLHNETGVDATASLTDTTYLGIFEDTALSLGFSMAINVTLRGATAVEASRSVVSLVMAPVNGRLCSFYMTVPYVEETDRARAEAGVKAWRDAVVAANPRAAGPEAKSWSLVVATKMALTAGLVFVLVRHFGKKRAA